MQNGDSNNLKFDEKRNSTCKVIEDTTGEGTSDNNNVSFDAMLNPSTTESLMDELINDAIWDVCIEVFAFDVIEELIEDAIWDVCFEVHRFIKLGYFSIENSAQENKLSKDTDKDIHDKTPSKCKSHKLEQLHIPCPVCQYTVFAGKFAFHLARCIGLSGRASSRVASQRLADGNKNDSDDSEYDANWYKKKTKKNPKRKSARKRLKVQGNFSPKPSEKIGGCYQEMTFEERKTFLNQMCGVLSKRSNKMCMNTHYCSVHTDEQRRHVRHGLLGDRSDQLKNYEQIDVDTVDEDCSELSLFMPSLSTLSHGTNITSVSD